MVGISRTGHMSTSIFLLSDRKINGTTINHSLHKSQCNHDNSDQTRTQASAKQTRHKQQTKVFFVYHQYTYLYHTARAYTQRTPEQPPSTLAKPKEAPVQILGDLCANSTIFVRCRVALIQTILMGRPTPTTSLACGSESRVG
jgi:hypothetical protein